MRNQNAYQQYLRLRHDIPLHPGEHVHGVPHVRSHPVRVSFQDRCQGRGGKESAPSGLMLVDGTSIGDAQEVVIRDRVMLAQDGMFVIIALVDQKTGKLKKSPDLISRGFVYLKENQELLRQVRIIIKKSVEDKAIKNLTRLDNHSSVSSMDFDRIKMELGETVSKFLYQKTEKRPLVIPVILNV